jgi:hypothetical protein
LQCVVGRREVGDRVVHTGGAEYEYIAAATAGQRLIVSQSGDDGIVRRTTRDQGIVGIDADHQLSPIGILRSDIAGVTLRRQEHIMLDDGGALVIWLKSV